LALAQLRVRAYSVGMSSFSPTKQTQVQRLPDRGKYDAETVFKILDEAFVCHVGFAVDGQPFVIPTNYARVGEKLYIHGSAASRMLKTLAGSIPVCVTVTLVDGLVMARSAFHHSVNYRSVVALGRAVLVEDPAEKMRALELFTNHVAPGRWNEVRTPTDLELKGTTVMSLDLSGSLRGCCHPIEVTRLVPATSSVCFAGPPSNLFVTRNGRQNLLHREPWLLQLPRRTLRLLAAHAVFFGRRQRNVVLEVTHAGGIFRVNPQRVFVARSGSTFLPLA
jgi:nitroimidazol reductase NimA-like FMN-containing flavoprotein (pyridoxamine 5'-phosphate oxidase superfamily)